MDWIYLKDVFICFQQNTMGIDFHIISYRTFAMCTLWQVGIPCTVCELWVVKTKFIQDTCWNVNANLFHGIPWILVRDTMYCFIWNDRLRYHAPRIIRFERKYSTVARNECVHCTVCTWTVSTAAHIRLADINDK